MHLPPCIVTDQCDEAPPQFDGSTAVEGQGDDAFGGNTPDPEQVGDAVDDHACLAGAGPGGPGRAPAGTPRAVIDKIQADVAKALAVPEVRERFIAQGAQPGGATADQFTAFIRAETEKWAKVVKVSNARVD